MNFASPYIYCQDDAQVVREEEIDRTVDAGLSSAVAPQGARLDDEEEVQEKRKAKGMKFHNYSRAQRREMRAPKPSSSSSVSSSAFDGGRQQVPQQQGVYRRQVDTNVVAIRFDDLIHQADDMFPGDPIFCTRCKAVFSRLSKVRDPAEQEQERPFGKDVIIIEKSEGDEPANPLQPPPSQQPQGADAMKVDQVPEPAQLKEEDEKQKKFDIWEDDQKDWHINAAGERVWDCEFCGYKNAVDVDKEDQPVGDSRDYVLEPAPEQKEENKSEDEGLVIFCIDISGSMAVTKEVRGKINLKGANKMQTLADFGLDAREYEVPQIDPNVTNVSRLQAVQAAVDEQLEQMKKQHPKRRVCLITFNNEVVIHGDQPITIVGDKLHNHQELQKVGRENVAVKAIEQSRDKLSDRLFGLEPKGPTALGPALLVATSMASTQRGSSVVVCTDGLANVGLGSLDVKKDGDREAASNWYDGVGQFGKISGVTISVVSIIGDECSLENLGRVAEATGGSVTRVDPLQLEKNFSTMFANPIIATQVSISFLLHQGLAFRNEETRHNQFHQEVGNVTADREILLEFGVRSAQEAEKYKHLNELPFQLQICFTTLKGMKALRVISRAQKVTQKREEAEAHAKVEIVSANAIQQTSRLVQKGQYQAALANNLLNARYMGGLAQKHDGARKVYSRWMNDVESINDVVAEQEANDEDDEAMEVLENKAQEQQRDRAPAPEGAGGGGIRGFFSGLLSSKKEKEERRPSAGPRGAPMAAPVSAPVRPPPAKKAKAAGKFNDQIYEALHHASKVSSSNFSEEPAPAPQAPKK